MHDRLIDTDVLIWYLRGHVAAGVLLDGLATPVLSAVSYVELVQGCRNKQELTVLQQDLSARKARTLPIDDSISHRAIALIEAHALSSGLQLADALIAATGLHHDLPLVTANTRHFATLDGLHVEPFSP